MPTRTRRVIAITIAFAGLIGTGFQSAFAQDEAPAAAPLYQGFYAAVLGRYVKTDDHSGLDNGGGGVIAGGFRRGPVAFEVRATYAAEDPSPVLGAGLDISIFPFKRRLPGLFAITGVGFEHIGNYPNIGGASFNVTTLEGGLGYILPLHIGRYQFGLRAEALYQYGRREERAQNQLPPGNDLPVESNFHSVIGDIGLQFPFGLAPAPTAAPAPEAIRVVEVPPPLDSDGDGVTDDVDQCPGTPAGTKVDEKGCPLPPPPRPCRTPEPGERVSLAGCGTGDVIVLRGVNFEFNQSKLEVNAKTILDNVADELKARPDLKIEVDGHTDSKGSDAYNQKLSERRAASVKQYLVQNGIAADRVSSAGFGETRPIADNATDEGRELNRRVEIRITASALPIAPAAVAEPAPVASPDSTSAPANSDTPAAAEPAAPASSDVPADSSLSPAPSDAADTATPATGSDAPASAEPAAATAPAPDSTSTDSTAAPPGGDTSPPADSSAPAAPQ